MKTTRLLATVAGLAMTLLASGCGSDARTAGTVSETKSPQSSLSASPTPCGLEDAVADLRSLTVGVDVGAPVQRSEIEPLVRSTLRLRVIDKAVFVAASYVTLDLSTAALGPPDDRPPNTSSDVSAVLVVVAPIEANKRTDFPAFAYSIFEQATGRALWAPANVLCSGGPELEVELDNG